MASEQTCDHCGRQEATFACGECNTASYCSSTCQQEGWDAHSTQCSAPLLGKYTGEGDAHGHSSAAIWVTGRASLLIEPDIASARFSSVGVDKQLSDAREISDGGMSSLRAALAREGVLPRDIRTVVFSIGPRREMINNVWTHVGFRVENTVVVTIRAIGEVGHIIDAAMEVKGFDITVSDVRFEIDNPEQYEIQLRKEAVEDAVAKADQISRAAGEKRGYLVFVSDGTQPASSSPARAVLYAEARSESATTTPVSGGENELVVTVRAGFALDH